MISALQRVHGMRLVTSLDEIQQTDYDLCCPQNISTYAVEGVQMPDTSIEKYCQNRQ